MAYTYTELTTFLDVTEINKSFLSRLISQVQDHIQV